MDRRTLLLGSLGLGASASSRAVAERIGPIDAPQAPKRFAVVIANQDYEKNPLPNIFGDAELMRRTLESLGFTVLVARNARRPEMRAALRTLRDRLAAAPGSLAFVYYSGHGVQIDGENYLVPVDNAALDAEADVKEDCLSLGYVLENAKGSAAKAYVVVLDACRDNPFLGRKGDGSKGLAVVGRTLDATTLVAFAASPGETASALGGGSSVYTAELARNLVLPGVSIEDVFKRTRAAVREKTGNKQRPREDSGLEEAVFLAGGAAPAPVAPEGTGPAVRVAPTAVRLTLTGVPAGAKVSVDGTVLQGLVHTDEIAAKSKEVEVAVEAPGFRPYVATVTLERGKAVELAVALERKSNRTEPIPETAMDRLRRLVDEAAAAAAQSPGNPQLRIRLGNALADLGKAQMDDQSIAPSQRYPLALRTLRAALKEHPKHPTAASQVRAIEDAYRSMGRPIPR